MSVTFGMIVSKKKKGNNNMKGVDMHKGKMLGAYLPNWIHVYISLYALAKRKTKTEVLKEIIESWIRERKPIDTEEELLRSIITYLNADWEVTKVVTPEISYSTYCDNLKRELEIKGLQKTQIDNIINKLRY